LFRPKVLRPELKEELRLELAVRLEPLLLLLLMAAFTLRLEAAEEREELVAVKVMVCDVIR
jgi:hypothetical protein